MNQYLLVDARPPAEFFAVKDLTAATGCDPDTAQDALDQPIIGVFIMPEGVPVTLVADSCEDGVHIGTYKLPTGETGQLPIGEVRTPAGRVFKLDESL